MGRAQGHTTTAVAYRANTRRGGDNGRGAFGKPRGTAGGAPTRDAQTARKFHIEDLQHHEGLLRTAASIRETALRRGSPRMTGHAVEARINDHLRTLTAQEVYASLKSGTIIEINDGPGQDDMRMLVRDDNGTCVVYSVGLHRIVTCWWNDPTDNHRTLDRSAYMPLDGEEGPRQCKRILMRGVKFLAA